MDLPASLVQHELREDSEEFPGEKPHCECRSVIGSVAEVEKIADDGFSYLQESGDADSDAQWLHTSTETWVCSKDKAAVAGVSGACLKRVLPFPPRTTPPGWRS